MGFIIPAMFAESFKPHFNNRDRDRDGDGKAATVPAQEVNCPDCYNPITKDSKFCPHFWHQQLILDKCVNCGKSLPPSAKFCQKVAIRRMRNPLTRNAETVMPKTCQDPHFVTSVVKKASLKLLSRLNRSVLSVGRRAPIELN